MHKTIPRRPFDPSTAYLPEPPAASGDGREESLLSYLLAHPTRPSFASQPASILSAIDEYARTTAFLMNVGPAKGAIVVDEIMQQKPRVCVELGGYVGYSAVIFGAAIRAAAKDGEGAPLKYYSLELSEKFAAIARQIVSLAGLDDVVTFVVGSAADGLRRLKEEYGVEKVDMFFLDHYKPAYKPDLQVAEELSLVQVGTVLVADNVVRPGAPGYLEYVRDQGEGENVKYEGRLEESWEPSGEPDGVEISRCIEVKGV